MRVLASIPKKIRIECVFCRDMNSEANLPVDLKLAGWARMIAAGNLYSNGALVRERTHIGWCPKCAKQFQVEE